MKMTELINLFKKLGEFFICDLVWEQIEELYEKETEAKSKQTAAKKPKQTNQQLSDSDEEAPLCKGQSHHDCGDLIVSLSLVRRAVDDPQVLSTLLELCTEIRSLRGDEFSSSYDNTYDCWDQVVKVAPRDSFLAAIFALAGLVSLDVTSSIYAKLSLAAVDTYFLSLTVPGAKGYHIFEEEVIAHCLQVFSLVERIQNPDVLRRMSRQQPVEIWVRFATLCDDLKLLLRYVHFSEHKGARNAFIRKLIDIQHLNHERGFANFCK